MVETEWVGGYQCNSGDRDFLSTQQFSMRGENCLAVMIADNPNYREAKRTRSVYLLPDSIRLLLKEMQVFLAIIDGDVTMSDGSDLGIISEGEDDIVSEGEEIVAETDPSANVTNLDQARAKIRVMHRKMQRLREEMEGMARYMPALKDAAPLTDKESW